MDRSHIAFGLIDAQRGFMPAAEGVRLGVAGFGELPIPEGDRIVPPVNRLLATAALRGYRLFTTQDWHPTETAHFSAAPNYVTTWPVHCVAATPGAALHPGIVLPRGTAHFLKGDVALQAGEQDESYSGYSGHTATGESLAAWLRHNGITEVVLGGLALDYCVKATALDLRQQAGLEVTVIRDATAPVAPATGEQAVAELTAAGVRLATTDQWLAQPAEA